MCKILCWCSNQYVRNWCIKFSRLQDKINQWNKSCTTLLSVQPCNKMSCHKQHVALTTHNTENIFIITETSCYIWSTYRYLYCQHCLLLLYHVSVCVLNHSSIWSRLIVNTIGYKNTFMDSGASFILHSCKQKCWWNFHHWLYQKLSNDNFWCNQ